MKRNAARKAKAVTAKKRGGKSKVDLAKKPRKCQAAVAAKIADAINGLVSASAQALGLKIEPAWYGGVKFNLQLILRIGALVDEFSLPDCAEPAPVFHA
jgi:Protein of unknown function (DUF4089)